VVVSGRLTSAVGRQLVAQEVWMAS